VLPTAPQTGGVTNATDQIGRITDQIGRIAVTVDAVTRTFRQQIDEGILDKAAALFARRGFAKTSVQDIADTVGLSKAGLLHHWPSKDALYAAVLSHAESVAGTLFTTVGDAPLGPRRDRLALEAIVDIALAHPGLVSLLLSPVLAGDGDGGTAETDATGAQALRAFGVDPDAPASERSIRVVGALGALAVLALAANQQDQTLAWRRDIVATCFDALGHRADFLSSDQVEA
jgi:AcrR family transcriptional regulator